MFRDVSDRIAHNPPALHYGVAAADVDGDGRPEFVVAGFGGPNRVLKWAGGQLRDVAPPELADAGRQAIGLAAADLDGDGEEELYVLNTDTYAGPKAHADRLFDRRPGGGWDDLFSRPDNRGARNLSAGRSVCALDRRGTGRYGFFVANYGRPMRLYESNEAGRLADVAPGLGMARVTGGRGLWSGPLVGGRADLLCLNEHGANFLFAGRGDGTFAECAAEHGLDDAGEHGRGVASFDAGGGRLGLAWGNWEGPHRLMIRGADGRFRDRASPALALPGAVRTVIAADFDNDGWDELFLNFIGEPNRLFRLTPDGPNLLDPGAALLPDWLGTGAAVADVDGDGVLELLVAHGENGTQPLALFKAEPAGGCLRVQPRTRFGAPARGAVVRLDAGGRARAKCVDAGSGYLSQMEPWAHFGLGGAAPERLEVRWPDGARAVVERPAGEVVVDYPG